MKTPESMMIPYDLAIKLQVRLSALDVDDPIIKEYIEFVVEKKKALIDRMNYKPYKDS